MEKLLCVQDFAEEAEKVLPPNVANWVNSFADDGTTFKQNRDCFLRWQIRPQMLRDVRVRSTSVQILGKESVLPIGISPMGMQQTIHPEGECGVAKAAEAMGAIFTLSMFGTASIEQVAEAAPKGRKWFHIFVHKDRDITQQLIRRAERCGYEAIVLTVDAQYVGKRLATRREPLKFPSHLRLGTVAPDISVDNLDFDELHSVLDFGLTWEVIEWIKKTTKLPLVLKGIQTGADAKYASELGADAILVSNHGGRQIDTAPATIDILSEIVEAVGGKAEVYLDSGVTRGTDIFKVLALGAKMAFLGRSMVYGLAVGGSAGAKQVLNILKEELDLTMALAGVASTQEITRQFVQRGCTCNT